MKIKPGKVKMYGIVRDKNGKIKYDDWDSLDPVLKEYILKEERENGRNVRDSRKKRSM